KCKFASWPIIPDLPEPAPGWTVVPRNQIADTTKHPMLTETKPNERNTFIQMTGKWSAHCINGEPEDHNFSVTDSSYLIIPNNGTETTVRVKIFPMQLPPDAVVFWYTEDVKLHKDNCPFGNDLIGFRTFQDVLPLELGDLQE